MTRNNYTCGIDIGTHTTRVVVIGHDKNKNDCLLAIGQSHTEGMRLGYITNVEQVAKSVKKAIEQAEKMLGSKIRHAYVSIGGISLSSQTSTGTVIISKADQEITHLDISKAMALCEEDIELLNRKIIHIIPIGFKLDGKDIHGKPEGMHGTKLEVKTLFITCLKQNIEDIVTALALINIEVKDIVASPIASSFVLLNHKQKVAGCVLIDIGAETVSISCFENNTLISLQVFSIGSMDITKDVALGFKIALEEAESIKIGSVVGGDYSKKKVSEIIEARLIDIFELVQNHLKKIKRNELLAAGAIITGGGSQINEIEDIAKSQLKLPARVGPMDSTMVNKFKMRDSSWYTALGLALGERDGVSTKNNIHGGINDQVKEIKDFFKNILSQLLP